MIMVVVMIILIMILTPLNWVIVGMAVVSIVRVTMIVGLIVFITNSSTAFIVVVVIISIDACVD